MSVSEQLAVCAEEIVARCKLFASFSEDASGTRRTFLSPPMRDCHRELTRWLVAAGAEVTIDAAGNFRGFYPGAEPSSPKLLLGSHLDTVPNAGAYDGVLGVLLGAALLESLHKRKMPFAVEVVGFSEEEGVRFGVPFIGSRALVGRLDDNLLSRTDNRGVSVREAIQNFGLNPANIPDALEDDVLAYLEFHIEQGPVLESLQRPLAAVEAIAAQTRMEFLFSGHANHAGTTPMHLRKDALAAAAEWISTVERTAQGSAGLVATVGQIDVKPGAVNVIPGAARVTLDIRHKSDDVCARTMHALVRNAQEIADRRGLAVTHNVLLSQCAVPMDAFLVAQIERAIQSVGCEPHRMTSGAGHDAMILAEEVPVAMIFLRSPGGISHDPAESVLMPDVAKALACGLGLLDQLASSSQFLKRNARA